MKRSIPTVALGALLTLPAAACSSSAPQIPPAAPIVLTGSTPVTFVVVVPGGMRPSFVSPSTQSVVVTLAGTPLLTIDVSASSHACKTATGGARTCSGQAPAPSGSQMFDVAAYDGTAGGGNVLASGELAATLVAGRPARLRVALTGKPASLALSLKSSYPPAGTAASFGVTVAVLDADGNTIVGSYGPTSIHLTDSDASGATKLSTDSVANSAQRVALTYDGAPLSRAILGASAPSVPRASAAFAPSPTIVAQYPVPPVPGSLPAGLSDICIGPDGNVWGTASSSGAIEKIAPDGTFTTYPILNSEPLGISLGPDRNLWFVEQLKGKLAKITPSGKVTSYKIPVAPSGFSQPAWTARGPDGRTWFVDQGSTAALGAATPGGTISMYPLPYGSFPQEVVAGPDGRMWFTDAGLNAIVVMSTQGKIVATHRLPASDAQPWGIAVGPDGNLWFAEFALDRIGRMTPSGALKEFTVPTAVSGPLNVAAGPDGNVWFTESGGSIGIAGKIGYVTPDGSLIRDFPMSGNAFHAHSLAFDAAGTLWFTEFAGPESSLAKLIY